MGWRFRRRLSSFIAARLIGTTERRLARRRRFDRERQKKNLPHEILYFHEVRDPYSHLAAQALLPFLERFDVELKAFLVGEPSDSAVPERALFLEYNRRDAAEIAPYYNLNFHDAGKMPDASATELVERLLVGRNIKDFAKIAGEAGNALWKHDRAALEKLASKYGLADEKARGDALEEGNKKRATLGHYLSATFFYGKEWYWGVDRLHYLEARLAEFGARKAAAPEAPSVHRRRMAPDAMPGTPIMRLEFFPSLRSPYTYLSMKHVLDMPKRYPIELKIRPVLPMVMRGMKIPAAKGIYIFGDCKREGDRLGIPFGNMLDPVGKPVRRAYSLFPLMDEMGVGGEYLEGLLRASFAEGVDTHAPRFLKTLVENLGVSWEKAAPLLDGTAWKEGLEKNQQIMMKAGCWGVPSFLLTGPEGSPPFAIWGRDRIWRLEEEIAKRAVRTS